MTTTTITTLKGQDLIEHLLELANEKDVEIERLKKELHDAGDGDTWREACRRVEAEIEQMKKLEDQLRAGIERVISGEADVSWLNAWYSRAVKPAEEVRDE